MNRLFAFFSFALLAPSALGIGGGAMEVTPTNATGIKVFVTRTEKGVHEVAIWVTDRSKLFTKNAEVRLVLSIREKGRKDPDPVRSELEVGSSSGARASALGVAMKVDQELGRQLRDDTKAIPYFMILSPQAFSNARIVIQEGGRAPLNSYWADLVNFRSIRR